MSRATRLFAALMAATLMLLAASASSALATSQVRFLQATPGAGSAHLDVRVGMIVTSAGGESSFGETTPYAAAPSGTATLTVAGAGLNAQLVHLLSAGLHYTVVATGTHAHPRLFVYRDRPAAAHTARLRIMHVAPELGSPDVWLDRRTIAQGIGFGSTTGYVDVSPGRYRLSVVSPRTHAAIASTALALAAGTATTAFVTGTHGAPVGISVASDSTVVPGGPPETGLGGLASGGGPRWLLIAAAAALGGAAAGLAQMRVRRRRSGRS